MYATILGLWTFDLVKIFSAQSTDESFKNDPYSMFVMIIREIKMILSLDQTKSRQYCINLYCSCTVCVVYDHVYILTPYSYVIH